MSVTSEFAGSANRQRGKSRGGARVFGYDNLRTEAGHVERRINPEEAAVVRGTFDLCIKGAGQIAIAKKLNEERAVAPRSQQGRPRAWSPSSVREVLYRDLSRGVFVWNKTRKWNTWGQVHATNRDASEWVSVPAPKLRIGRLLERAVDTGGVATPTAYKRGTSPTGTVQGCNAKFSGIAA